MRILHISDPHILCDLAKQPPAAFLSKRVAGWITLKILGRKAYFDQAESRLEALVELWRQEAPHGVVISGDMTAMAFPWEFKRVRELLEPLITSQKHVCGVPGNHDTYTLGAQRAHRFETAFPELVRTDLPEYCTDGPFPFVRLWENSVAVVGVNSARPNPAPWRSSGFIGAKQLVALHQILRDSRIQGRTILVVTHYGLKLPNGKPDSKVHRLDNARQFAKVLTDAPQPSRVILLHGHIHHTYRYSIDPGWPGSAKKGLSSAPSPGTIHCLDAGSVTCKGREGLWMLHIAEDGQQTQIQRGRLHLLPANQGGRSPGCQWGLEPAEPLHNPHGAPENRAGGDGRLALQGF